MDDDGQIARALVMARSQDAVLDAYPGRLPTSLAEAYAIQDVAIGLSGARIAGWKLGRVAADAALHFGSSRLAGPIFADAIVDAASGGLPAMPVLRGFAAVEAELLVRTARAVPGNVTLGQVPDYVQEVRIGLEIASSPFVGINDNGPAVTASDFGNNHGLVLGPSIPDWRERDLLRAPVSLRIDGAVAGEGCAADMLDGPFGSVAFLAHLLAERGHGLGPGCWISTGALTGVHPIAVGQVAEASFDEDFHVGCAIRAFQPTTRNGEAT